MHSSSYNSSWGSSIASPYVYCIHDDYKLPLNDQTKSSCSELAREVDQLASCTPFAQNSGFFAAERPSPIDILHQSSSADDMGDSSVIAPFEEDVLMNPVLVYINEMLMEEGMKDRMCMLEDCIPYQAIVNGFYEIIGEQNPRSQPSLSEDNKKLLPLEGDDEYSWIDQILNSNPSTPRPPAMISSSSQISILRQEKAEGESVKPWAKDCFVNAQTMELQENVLARPSFEVYRTSNVAGSSFYSDAVSTEGPLLQRKGDHAMSLIHMGLEDVRLSNSGLQLDNTRLYSAAGEEDCAADSGRSTGGQPLAPPGISFVKNEDLKVEADYEILYAGKWSPRGVARNIKSNYGGAASTSNGKRTSVVGSSKKKDMKGINSNGNAAVEFGNVRELLVSCAQAVAAGDVRTANNVLQEVRRHGASPNGQSGLHRLAHYFSEALAARMCGTGGCLYTATFNNRPWAAKLLKTFKLALEACPYLKLAYYFANQSILKAAEGASRLHIVDYGIFYGIQWPYLINSLADRKEGPPLLIITGIDFPQPGLTPTESVEGIGRRLAEYARTYNVPFEYHAIAARAWEDIEPSSLHLCQGEVLVVNCTKRLQHLLDESVVASSPRQKVLSRMRDLNPNLLVTGVMNAGCNATFFVSRFREAIYYYSSTFDMLDTTWGESPERMTVERDFLGREILNIVACEGVERVERAETYKQWQARIQRAGFEQLPIIPTILSRSSSHVKKHYHKYFNIHDDSNRWMLLGWKGRTSMAISAWKPIPT